MGLIKDFCLELFSADTVEANQDDERWWDQGHGFSVSPTIAGVKLNPQKALGLAAYYACIKVLSEDIAKLPFQIFSRAEDNSKTEERDNPLWPLINLRPNPDMTAFTFWQTQVSYMAGWGDMFAEIVRNRLKEPIELWPIHPSRVQIKRNPQKELYYRIYLNNGNVAELTKERMFHVPNMGNGVRGYSVAHVGRESLGLAIAERDFGAAYYGNGVHIGGIITVPEALEEPAQKRMRKSWAEAYGGGPKNAHHVAVLEQGASFAVPKIPVRDAQFLEAQQFSVEETCRFFRMPPHKIQHLLRATFRNVEHQDIEFVKDTLTPWAVRLEQGVNHTFDLDEQGLFSEFMLQALLRGDAKARGEMYWRMFQMSAITPNQIRGKENMNPYVGGDRYYVQMNMVPVDKVDEMIDARSMPKQVQEPTDDDEKDDDDEKEEKRQQSMDLFRPILQDAATRMFRKESHALTNAAGKDSEVFSDLVDRFYPNHETQTIEALTPGLQAFADAVGGGWIGYSHDLENQIANMFAVHIEEARVRYGVQDLPTMVARLKNPAVQAAFVEDLFALFPATPKEVVTAT